MIFIVETESDLLRDLVRGIATIHLQIVDWLQLLCYKLLVKIWADVHVGFLYEGEFRKFTHIDPAWNSDLDLIL